jgi:hypothetical protein
MLVMERLNLQDLDAARMPEMPTSPRLRNKTGTIGVAIDVSGVRKPGRVQLLMARVAGLRFAIVGAAKKGSKTWVRNPRQVFQRSAASGDAAHRFLFFRRRPLELFGHAEQPDRSSRFCYIRFLKSGRFDSFGWQ